jgi:hypothetical protein
MGDIYVVRLGLTLGLIWGISIYLLSLLVDKNYGVLFFKILEDAYPGCSRKTCYGKLICGSMGFLDGFLGGILIGILYNNINIKY